MAIPNQKLRILLIAEACNPEWNSVPLVGWSHSRALAEVAEVHLVTQIRNRDAIVRAGLTEGQEFTAINSEAAARPFHRSAGFLRGGQGKGWTMHTVADTLSYYYFEHLVWRQFGEQIRGRKFDVVHRLTPLSPTAPSFLAAKCRRAGVSFILGPLNGGVPWPKEFDAARRDEKEWLSYVRSAYKLLPGTRSTRNNASAILIGSRDTWSQYCPRYQDKSIYIPENAVDPSRFPEPASRSNKDLLEAVFVGRLVPYKGADMALEGAADLIRSGKMMLTLVGDGPERERLLRLSNELGVAEGVRFVGRVPQTEVYKYLERADLFLFPSIREFGGAVALEAMAMGAVPVVVDYGGPAELVNVNTGYLLALGSRQRIIEQMRKTLGEIADHPEQLLSRREAGMRRVRQWFTWSAKAQQVLEVYRWVLGVRQDKPDFGMPFRDHPDEADASPDASDKLVGHHVG